MENETRIKKDTSPGGLRGRIHALLHGAFTSASQRYADGKFASFDHKEIFLHEDMAQHFAHIILEDAASQNVVKGFIIDRIEFIESVLGRERISRETFIDIGDPDGMFIKALKKDGLSANISEIGVANIHRKGIQALRCDAERLPLKDASIDNILYFEIFEHLPNPVSGLKELHRVANKSVILSIPFVSKTTIHRCCYNPDWPVYEHHVFELDDTDFGNIASHAGFYIRERRVVTVLAPRTFKEHMAFLLWDAINLVRKDPEYQKIHRDLYLGCFKRFCIYYLVKTP